MRFRAAAISNVKTIVLLPVRACAAFSFEGPVPANVAPTLAPGEMPAACLPMTITLDEINYFVSKKIHAYEIIVLYIDCRSFVPNGACRAVQTVRICESPVS